MVVSGPTRETQRRSPTLSHAGLRTQRCCAPCRSARLQQAGPLPPTKLQMMCASPTLAGLTCFTLGTPTDVRALVSHTVLCPDRRAYLRLARGDREASPALATAAIQVTKAEKRSLLRGASSRGNRCVAGRSGGHWVGSMWRGGAVVRCLPLGRGCLALCLHMLSGVFCACAVSLTRPDTPCRLD